jgi:6,7-dimethyl-8-ribityllumazine synthase
MFLEVLNLFMAKKMLQTQNVDAVIAIGCYSRANQAF